MFVITPTPNVIRQAYRHQICNSCPQPNHSFQRPRSNSSSRVSLQPRFNSKQRRLIATKSKARLGGILLSHRSSAVRLLPLSRRAALFYMEQSPHEFSPWAPASHLAPSETLSEPLSLHRTPQCAELRHRLPSRTSRPATASSQWRSRLLAALAPSNGRRGCWPAARGSRTLSGGG